MNDMQGQKGKRSMMWTLAGGLMLATLAVGAMGAIVRGGDANTKATLDQVKTAVHTHKAVLLDVREKSEWDRGHLKDATLLPLSKLENWERHGLDAAGRAELAKAIPAGAIVYCHCAMGGRAVPASEILRALKYDARPLREGYRQLVGAGFPVAGR